MRRIKIRQKYRNRKPVRAETWIMMMAVYLLIMTAGISVSAASAEETDSNVESDMEVEVEVQVQESESSASECEISSDSQEIIITQDAQEDGINVSKTVQKNEDGTFQITLESYVTGTTTASKAAADIVLVVDVSGSMNIAFSEDSTRMDALKTAAAEFVETLQEQNEGLEEGEQSRVALVQFGLSSDTEIISPGIESEDDCFVYVNEEGAKDLITRIENLEAGETTGTDMEIALVYAQAALEESSGERDKVVVFFTDGAPNTAKQDGFVVSAANSALEVARDLKSSGVELYVISIDERAQTGLSELPVLSELITQETDAYACPGYPAEGAFELSDEEWAALYNRFLYLLSSVNPEADSIYYEGTAISPDGKDYCYSAETTQELCSVFQSVAVLFETEADSTLGSEAQTRDYITSAFTLTDSNGVRVYTAAYLGGGQWADPVDVTEEMTITLSEDCQGIYVSGFDYSSQYVSEYPHAGTSDDYGKKLIISFSITANRTFGGNQIPTNETSSGIYADSQAQTEEIFYPVPEVDLEIDYAIGVCDQIVYVPDKADLLELLLFPDDYIPDGGLNSYVDITYVMTDEDGNEVGWLYIPHSTPLSECSWSWADEAGETAICGTYLITCTVAPISEGTYSAREYTVTGNVHVLHPVLMMCDSLLYYGDEADVQAGDYTGADGLQSHLLTYTWTCGHEVDYEDEPLLGYRVNELEGVDENNVICTTDDIPITIRVFRISQSGSMETDITEEVSFIHDTCDLVDTCGYIEGQGYQCLIHVLRNTALIKVTKKDSSTLNVVGGAEYELFAEDGTYIETIRIDSEGLGISETEVKEGAYYLKETKAPDGYYISDENISFLVTSTHVENGEISVVVYDEPLARLPSTGGDGVRRYFISALMLAAVWLFFEIGHQRLGRKKR